MTIQLFQEEDDISLKERENDANYEDYTGIVLDKTNNMFKVITGKFTDKKDFYEKMSDRGLILRKCFEKKVYDWVKENAKTTLDAYLMLSTAFSKWKGNNMLSDYYNKLLKDIPELNREGQKGNPNTRGKEESTLTEKLSIYKKDELDVDSLYDSGEVVELFRDTSLSQLYKDAIAEKDPLLSARGIVEAYAKNNKIPLDLVKGGSRFTKNASLVKQISSDVSTGFTNTGKVSLQNILKANDLLKYTRNASVYRVRITPVIGSMKQVKEHLKEKNTFRDVWWPIGLKEVTDSVSDVKVALPDFDSATSLKGKFKNPMFYQVIRSMYTEITADFGRDFVGCFISVYFNDIDVTKASMKNISPTAFHDFYTLDGELFKKQVLPANEGLTPDNKLFISKGTLQAFGTKAINISDGIFFDIDKVQPDYAIIQRAHGDILSRGEVSDQLFAVKKYSAALADIAKVETEDENNELVVLDRKRRTVLNDKLVKISSAGNNQETYKLALTATEIINNVIDPTIRNDYVNAMITKVLPEKHKADLNALEVKAAADEIFQSADFAEISKVTQGSGIHDKLIALKDLMTSGKSLYVDPKDGKIKAIDDKDYAVGIKKPKTLSTKKSKKQDKTEEEKLLNQLRVAKNNVNYWAYRSDNAKGRDKEAIDQLKKSEKMFDAAREAYDDYIKKNNLNNDFELTDEISFEEAAVNSGASSYYMDQQNAEKNALCASSINEEVTHSELNPLLFKNEMLKPEILDVFLEIANKFKQSLKISIDPVDVYFTGSNANYNYNEASDIDIHLVYDFERVGIAADVLEKYLKDAKRLFNLDYSDIRVKGIKVEVGYENKATPLVATAVYSLRNNNWIKKPNTKSISIADPNPEYYDDITSRIESAIQDKDYSKLHNLWKEITNLRKSSLGTEGEFGEGNALFKRLRNLGTLGRLRDAYYKAASKELSLESIGEE